MTRACWRIRPGEPAWPRGLDALGDDAPGCLYGCGEIVAVAGLDTGLAVTVVGARRAGDYGLRVARELGRCCAEAGLTVVSGLALGIDAAAHEGALDAGGGRTVAVLAGGPDMPYPARHSALYGRILGAGGAIVSESAPGAETTRWGFPRRNRLMAALSKMTVIVEAALASGSMITADRALELSDRIVGAVPGRITDRLAGGPNALIAEGAMVVRGADDVLDQLLGIGITGAGTAGPPLEEELRELLDAVEAVGGGLDELGRRLGLGPGELASGLARLELCGYVACDATGRFSRTALKRPARR